MHQGEPWAIVQRARNASLLAALTGLMLLLATGRARSGDVPFGPQRIIQGAGAQSVLSAIAADLDGDGDQDVLSASPRDHKIAWYENTDGLGAFGPQQVITNSAIFATSVFAADLDGDGDMDVLSSSRHDDKIAWYENLDGLGGFSPEHVITASADGAEKVIAADLDGDGDMDVLWAAHGADKIAWHENLDGLGEFGPQQAITESANGAGSVFAADLDGDGDMDVLSALGFFDKIVWYENLDGLGAFGPEQVITESADLARSVFAADLDGDGDKDVLSASDRDDKIAWYENTDGLGAFGPQRVITESADGAASVFAADLDGDGDMDVLAASRFDNKIAWYENLDGLGAFGPQQVIATLDQFASVAFAADLDGDGDMDVLAPLDSYPPRGDKIVWYENTTGLGDFGPEQIFTTSVEGPVGVLVADLDKDGDKDVLSASERDHKIAWYENTDGLGAFGPQRVITGSANGAQSVFVSDLDGDGDMDVISASIIDYKNAWYENLMPPNAVPYWEFYD